MKKYSRKMIICTLELKQDRGNVIAKNNLARIGTNVWFV